MYYTKCANGHVYDSDQYSVCPYCNRVSTEIKFGAENAEGKTMAPNFDRYPTGNDGFSNVWQSRGEFNFPDNNGEIEQKTVAPNINNSRGDDGRTVAIFDKNYGVDPVVGWLVCTKGANLGKDFSIHARINCIGRSSENDICIRGDNTISNRAHAKLSYDPRSNQFTLISGDGPNINYLNGQPVYAPSVLFPYDTIDMGMSEFIFVPLCCDKFTWNFLEEKKNQEDKKR